MRFRTMAGATMALTMGMGLVASGLSSIPVNAAATKSGRLVIFTWWTGTASSEGLQHMIDLYHKQYPGVKVVNDAVAGGGGSNSKAVLASRMEANKPPGTFQVHAGSFQPRCANL
jgi:glucose/mannose transport system substrate-binding protein